MEAIEKDGKYLVAFPTREAAELHIAALQKQQEPSVVEHESLGDKVKNLVSRLKLHGIHDADKPVPQGSGKEVAYDASVAVIAAKPEQATPGPVITREEPTVNGPAEFPERNEDESAQVLAAEEAR